MNTYFTIEEKERMKNQFLKNGFFKQRILNDDEIESLRADYASVLSTASGNTDDKKHSSSLQHLGDSLSSFGQEQRHYYFHILTTAGTAPLHRAYYHPKVLEIVEYLLGENLIINNASMLAANSGTHYNLGWHRDVIQIPQGEIRDELFSPQRHHNSCQINLPLYKEDFLQVVPGSHNRPNSAAENAAFDGTKHYAPLNADMPGAQKVLIEAGSAAFYNNNLIHRGYCEKMENARRTLHMGYHSATRKPTWHFYLLNPQTVTQDHITNLDPKLQEMMHEYRQCYELFQNMEDTWKPGWDGNP